MVQNEDGVLTYCSGCSRKGIAAARRILADKFLANIDYAAPF